MSRPQHPAGAIELPLASGVVVRGRHWRSGPVPTRLLHEPGRDLDAWGSMPELLRGDGLSVLAVDLPGHGLSDDPWRPAELPTVLAALVRSVQRPEDGKVFIVAAGRGATIAVLAPGELALADIISSSPEEIGEAPTPLLLPPARPELVSVGAHDEAAAVTARSRFKGLRGWSLASAFPKALGGTAMRDGE